ncbi:unnamed protein product [Mytilus edulis]|uniref:Uncharacterized protein n=1 Tax=Mytilus edulis TaxID=6550 RepID=A0A8S3QZF7_MYTED|nr:unnamed protein product [Mytilus edulis]
MFAFSDKTDSSAGITCFGQDVAAHADTVAVMICANLPKVHIDVIKSSRLTQWSCHSEDSSPDKRNMHNQVKATQSSDLYSNFYPKKLIANQERIDEDNKEITDESDEKDAAKFCLMFKCDLNNDVKEKQPLFHISHLKNPLLKSKKMTYW